jgi:hypothetical protein
LCAWVYKGLAMLTDEERLKIGQVWTFVNSNFGVWLLSTVVVGIGSYLITMFIQNQSTAHQNRETLYCLKFEIKTDADEFEGECKRADTRAKYIAAFNQLQYPKEKLLDYRTATMDRYAFEMVDIGTAQDKTDARNVIKGMTEIWGALEGVFGSADDGNWDKALGAGEKAKLDGQIHSILDSDIRSINIPPI